MGQNEFVNEACSISVKISSDYYEAYISVDCLDNPAALTKEAIKRALEDKNVVFGLDTNAIKKLISNPTNVRDFTVARGIRHENGENGKIAYQFDTELEMKPTVNEDGSVDFKNMNFLHTVEKGQVLAVRTMPTEGKKGTTVTGKAISCRHGKIVNFKVGKNVIQSEDGLSLIAAEKGNIEFVGGKVSIIKVLEIRDDVGVSTGNIDFTGKVIINGNVTTGYSVKSEEEVIINGIVEGAVIISGGDLFINGGVQGNDQATLDIKGNIVSKFINNAEVLCKGCIEADSIMHSKVTCSGDVYLKGKKSILVGGEIMTRGSIKAKMIGSEMGTTTYLKVGVDPMLMEDYHSAAEEMKNLTDSIKKLSQASSMLRKQYDQTKSTEIKAMFDKTEVSRTEYTQNLESTRLRLKQLSELLEMLKGSKVKADVIYPGVRIKMGNDYYNVKNELLKVMIVKDGGEIKAISI